ncbi:MAG: glutathione S-transferase [Caulobacterales bacterium]|nr:glutathione S-transferase [Caulobacterales bacterium]
MLTIHHLDRSRSFRLIWLLEELELAYELVEYKRDPDTFLGPDTLKAVHPLGKSPILTDAGLTLVESAAIAEYVIETYGQGRLIPPLDTPERIAYRQFLHYAEGSLQPLVLLKLIFDRVAAAPAPFFVQPIKRGVADRALASFVQPQMDLHLTYLEDTLSRSEWFAGHAMTAADIIMSFPLQAAQARCGLGEDRPHLAAFLERIAARPAYQRAEARGGPLNLVR